MTPQQEIRMHREIQSAIELFEFVKSKKGTAITIYPESPFYEQELNRQIDSAKDYLAKVRALDFSKIEMNENLPI